MSRQAYNLERTWRLLKPYTMVKQHRYLTSLQLASDVQDVPGDVVECGVWKGGMIAGIAHILGNQRQYWLFDSFEGLPPADLERDGYKATTLAGRCRADESYAQQAMQLAGIDSYTLVKGWFADTLPTATFDDGIALLRLDGDWYDSTTECLEQLYPKLNMGGSCIIDDYFYWPGCRQAVHDYLTKHDLTDMVQQTGPDPVAYIRKT